ncbi:MAG TPA: J domain-containing protein, partial [Solimonas sp.]
YFTHKGRDMAFACDRWDKVGDNIHAIAKTIEALRGIARWGTGDMMEAAFTGFAALPDPAHATRSHWREVLACPTVRTRAELDVAYRVARGRAHPDRDGGSVDLFDAVQRAYEIACREITNG